MNIIVLSYPVSTFGPEGLQTSDNIGHSELTYLASMMVYFIGGAKSWINRSESFSEAIYASTVIISVSKFAEAHDICPLKTYTLHRDTLLGLYFIFSYPDFAFKFSPLAYLYVMHCVD